MHDENDHARREEDLAPLIKTGPKWLNSAISLYFEDEIVPIPSPSSDRTEEQFQRRGQSAVQAANALSRLRSTVKASDAQDLLEVMRTAMPTQDLARVADWLALGRSLEGDLETALVDPETFARLTIALDIPLRKALEFRERMVRTSATVSVVHGVSERRQAESDLSRPSDVIEKADQAEVIIRACYAAQSDEE